MRKIIFFIVLLATNSLHSQKSAAEILKEYSAYAKIDTTKCRLLTELIDAENNNNIASQYNLTLEKYVKILEKNKVNKKKVDQFAVTVLINKGYFELYTSNYKKALHYYFKALPTAESNKDYISLCTIYNAIGSIFSDLEEIDKSIIYYNKVVTIAKKLNYKKKLGTVYNNLGYTFTNLNKLDTAYIYYQKSLKIRNELKDSLDIMQTLANIGGIYSRKSKYSKAINIYKQCYNYELKNNDEIGAFSSALNISIGYYRLKNYTKSEQYAEQSLQLAQKNNYHYGVVNACETLEKIYEINKNPYEIISVLNLKANAKDSIKESESKEILYKKEFEYETEKKEAQIKALSQQKKISQLENQRQKSIILFGVILILTLFISSYVLFIRYKTKKQNELLKTKLEETEKTLLAEKKASESELKALKSQMNPHFIFNALNSIQEQFMYGDKVIANEQMGNFTYLTRQILTVSGKKKIPLATEVDILTKYLELEKMRFDKDFTYEVKIDDAIDDEYIELPPMLIQPFIENSIKHGLLHKSGNKKVTINFELDPSEEYLICTIEDNGIGRKKSEEIKSKTNHNSFSTASINQRLKLLNENKTSNELLYYQDLFDDQGACIGTKVLLKIYL